MVGVCQKPNFRDGQADDGTEYGVPEYGYLPSLPRSIRTLTSDPRLERVPHDHGPGVVSATFFSPPSFLFLGGVVPRAFTYGVRRYEKKGKKRKIKDQTKFRGKPYMLCWLTDKWSRAWRVHLRFISPSSTY